DRARVHQAAASSLAPARRSSRTFNALSEMTIDAAPITSATPVAPTSSTVMRGMLRKLFITVVSSAVRIRTVGLLAPHLAIAPAAVLVDGASNFEASSTATEPRSACTERAERIAL